MNEKRLTLVMDDNLDNYISKQDHDIDRLPAMSSIQMAKMSMSASKMDHEHRLD